MDSESGHHGGRRGDVPTPSWHRLICSRVTRKWASGGVCPCCRSSRFASCAGCWRRCWGAKNWILPAILLDPARRRSNQSSGTTRRLGTRPSAPRHRRLFRADTPHQTTRGRPRADSKTDLCPCKSSSNTRSGTRWKAFDETRTTDITPLSFIRAPTKRGIACTTI